MPFKLHCIFWLEQLHKDAFFMLQLYLPFARAPHYVLHLLVVTYVCAYNVHTHSHIITHTHTHTHTRKPTLTFLQALAYHAGAQRRPDHSGQLGQVL